MPKKVGIGNQDFEKIISRNIFYVDKTSFIREWWENEDEVTLITRPRRFGKTLAMSMVERFFSIQYEGRGSLFEGLEIWQDGGYRTIQGTYPVISLSFANVKEATYEDARRKICQLLTNLYSRHSYLLEGDILTDQDRDFFGRVSVDMGDVEATLAVYQLSEYLYKYYGKGVIILLDEYDAPMQEAYVNGFWDEMSVFIRSMFNAAFKTDPYMERAILTGITRVGKESIFSDLNNLEVVTTTSGKYADSFGFTEGEVFASLDAYGLSDYKQDVKKWYDGFIFGDHPDIYNPWSILNFIDKRRLAAYWANSSSNTLIARSIREGSPEIKKDFEELIRGHSLKKQIDEQIIFDQLSQREDAVWSLLLACGYLKVDGYRHENESGRGLYSLSLTNKEVRMMFEDMVRGWFGQAKARYNDFIKALMLGDIDAMNQYMEQVALVTFSSFDTGKKPSEHAEPERFYHGFVLGLMVDLSDRYVILSNRESGFGRYDVVLEPLSDGLDAIILEFKVFDPKREKSLEDTARHALEQIKDKAYEKGLTAKGIPAGRIRKYGFAFEGKTVLIK